MTPLRLGTRGSALALWQAHHVAGLVKLFSPETEVEIVVVKTTGDARQDIPLQQMAGKGVFVREIEAALLRNEVDFAVHSAKDLQSENIAGLTLAAFCQRADARDALVSKNGERFADLPQGATVATGSPRRIAQLLHVRPDLRFVQIRGNVDTRLAKLARGEADAIILACAGLDRLDKSDVITERLPLDLCLPQVGQACVAVQCREGDTNTYRLLRVACDHAQTRQAVEIERAFLARLGGGCSAPVAAHAVWQDGMSLAFTGQIGSLDGAKLLQMTQQETVGTSKPERLSQRVFDALIALPETADLLRALPPAV